MPVTSVTATIGVAKQASSGTLAANPTFAHGLMSGTPITVEATQSTLEVTTGKRAAANVIRESVKSTVEVNAPAYLKTLGLYLLGALGTKVTTGAGPYVHTYATGDLSYLSFFLKGIGATNEAVRDCKIDELTLKFENAKPVEVNVKAAGTVFSYPAAFVPTTDETAGEGFLTPTGGTFSVDVIGGSPAAARVISGELTIKNNIATIDTSASVVPADTQEGIQEHTLKLTIVPDDLAAFRSTITGASNGTTVSQTVPVGSVSLSFGENGGTGSLAITGTKIAFLTAFPEVDPKGAPIEIELAGTAVVPNGGTSPLTYVLTNGQATY